MRWREKAATEKRLERSCSMYDLGHGAGQGHIRLWPECGGTATRTSGNGIERKQRTQTLGKK